MGDLKPIYRATFRSMTRWRKRLAAVRGLNPATARESARLTTSRRVSIEYASRLACAYLLSVTAATAIVLPLGGHALNGAHTYFTRTNIVTAIVFVVIGTIAVAVGGV